MDREGDTLMDYEVEKMPCADCLAEVQHFRERGAKAWVCSQLDRHHPLHAQSANWTLLRTRLIDVEMEASKWLDERNFLRRELLMLRQQMDELMEKLTVAETKGAA
jgi:predicted nuclease with TOPRIM domain